MSILTEDKSLRFGYTTGACAAAGVRAILLKEKGKPYDKVWLTALDGTRLLIPVKEVVSGKDGCQRAEVVKFSGDDPDITNGTSVFVELRSLPEGGETLFKAGEGIGIVTKPGLTLPVGEPAINYGPRKLMRQVLMEETGRSEGWEITISIPEGVKLAKRTLNPVLGIEGGISVIGTTGVIRPMSEEAFKNSLVPQIEVAKAAGFDSLIFVPGKIGEQAALSWGLPQEAMVQTSNFIGFMLEEAAKREIREILLFGHIGKLAKVAAGIFYTHNRIGDARLETIAAYAAAEGLPSEKVSLVLEANTTEDALSVLNEWQDGFCRKICDHIAARASLRAERYLFGEVKVGTVMTAMDRTLLGLDAKAREIGEACGWKMLQ
ncbi:MAG: cobalamin biosynthesis protein CbiD [Selenomonas ruminantium]|nr:cobalamin biosynthesis protein CbiD [Selenomonas ruminantium]